MIKKSCYKLFILTLVLGAQSLEAQRARPGKAHSVGTGIVYPTLNHSLFVNPAGLVDSPKFSLQGAYLVDPENIHASLTHGRGVWGVGAGFRQQGASQVEEFGLGLKLNILNFGVTARSSEFENFGFDTGFIFDLGRFRAGSVLRGVDNGVDRIDVGLGFLVNAITVEFDAKYGVDSKNWLFDAALAFGSELSVGVGYTFAYINNAFVGGDIHAGISLDVSNGLAIEAFYRPHPQEWSPGDWVLGAKLIF